MRLSHNLNQTTLEHEEVLLDRAQLENLSVNREISHSNYAP